MLLTVYTICSENKGDDQLPDYRAAYLCLCFRMVFSQHGSNILQSLDHKLHSLIALYFVAHKIRGDCNKAKTIL